MTDVLVTLPAGDHVIADFLEANGQPDAAADIRGGPLVTDEELGSAIRSLSMTQRPVSSTTLARW